MPSVFESKLALSNVVQSKLEESESVRLGLKVIEPMGFESGQGPAQSTSMQSAVCELVMQGAKQSTGISTLSTSNVRVPLHPFAGP